MKYELVCNRCGETFSMDENPFVFCPYCGASLSHKFNLSKDEMNIIDILISFDNTNTMYISQLSIVKDILSSKNNEIESLKKKIYEYEWDKYPERMGK